jgi:hypothetical protein
MAASDLPFDFSGRTVTIPAGTIVYRGQTDAFDIQISPQGGQRAYLRRPIITKDRHTYFGLRPEQTTLNYGITAQLEVREGLNLINITNLTAYTKLKQLMAEKSDIALESLRIAFPVRKGIIKRNSIKLHDFRVLDFLCTYTPFEGYIQPRVAIVDGGHMHAEMAVCAHSHWKLTAISQQAIAPPQGASYSSLLRDYKMRLTEQERLRAVAQAKRARAQERAKWAEGDDEQQGPRRKLAPMRLQL